MWPLLENFEQNVCNQTKCLGDNWSWRAIDYTFKQSKTNTETDHLNICVYTTNPPKRTTVTHMCLICSKETILLLKQYVLRDLYKKIEAKLYSYLAVYSILTSQWSAAHNIQETIKNKDMITN